MLDKIKSKISKMYKSGFCIRRVIRRYTPGEKCKIFGHKWTQVYIGFKAYPLQKINKNNIIGTYCERCLIGSGDLTDFLYNHGFEYCSHDKIYWEGKPGRK